MNKRLVLKTVLVCMGIFIIITSLSVFYIYQNYEFDTEEKYQVLVAGTDINPGEIINESMLSYKTIKESALNSHMITDESMVVGKKTLYSVPIGDYIINYNLLPREQWYEDEEKVIVLPMDIEGRLANLIKKGSLIDVKVILKDVKSLPQIVLSKIAVEDILDENGISLGDAIGSKKAFAKVVLNNEQRNKIYIASQLGKLIYELYCDSTQQPAAEEFVIPAEFINGISPTVQSGTSRDSVSLSTPEGGGR